MNAAFKPVDTSKISWPELSYLYIVTSMRLGVSD